MSLSIKSSWLPNKYGYDNVNGAGPANEGETSNDDLFGVLGNLSGLAGDVGDTINSLTKAQGKNGTPVNKPAIQPPDPNKQRNLWLIGGAVVAAIALVFVFKKL